ncbi:MAG: endonuclease MutS2 [Eubacteriaceae bacterium]|nr:endonuclease MutS2 [Eubacteriaceae bacterium]
MLKRTCHDLEFDFVRERIASYSHIQSAREQIMEMDELGSYGKIAISLDLVESAYEHCMKNGRLPLYGYDEVRELLGYLKKGGRLDCASLLACASSIKMANDVKRHIESPKEPVEALLGYSARLLAPLGLGQEITAKIISDSEVADDASRELFAVRSRIRAVNASIRDKLASIISSQESRKLLQDNIVTVRSGRFVVPVKSENKNKLGGIVHDTSSSGQTIFVEPTAVFEMNNQLASLRSEEAREVERILAELSGKILASAFEIQESEHCLIELDFLFAKAQYAFDNNHSKPQLSIGQTLRLSQARHPMIPAGKVVAIDLEIGGPYRQLVVTGPNTGGKTVALKTAGLCALMAQCGLFIPAAPGSVVGIFDAVFTDIGDEQSISQSLSTFSSHMTNIVAILQAMTPASLVLLDEVGAGTDPVEGAALAYAILNELNESGALSFATTHYSEIKRYAFSADGVQNASMEFDPVSLQPTFKLVMGIPGRSNAIEISRRLGLPDHVVDLASSAMGENFLAFEELIGELDEKLKGARDSYEAAQAAEKQAKLQTAAIREDLEALAKARDSVKTRAAAEARKVVADAKDAAALILKKAASAAASREILMAREEISLVSSEIEELVADFAPKANLAQAIAAPRVLDYTPVPGDDVYIDGVGSSINAYVISVDGEMALVQAGALRMQVAASRLAPKEPAAGEGKNRVSFKNTKSRDISPSLSIRGKNVLDAQLEVEKYLDDASLASLKIVTIIHGKGTGTLRKEVERILDDHPLVEKYRIGEIGEGGEGATIVYLA